MFSRCDDTQRWTLVAVTALVAIAVAFWMTREKARGDVLALALVLGGAIGNILDRIRHGFVVDFADLHFGTFRPFLIFNVADACITLRSAAHTAELQSLMRNPYAVYRL